MRRQREPTAPYAFVIELSVVSGVAQNRGSVRAVLDEKFEGLVTVPHTSVDRASAQLAPHDCIARRE